MSFFSSLYFLIITPSVLFLLGASNTLYKKVFSKILVLLVLPLYLLGMYRSAGVDIKGYRRLYDYSTVDLFDPGFASLISMGKFIGINFEGFLLSIGILTAYLYSRVSNFFSVQYGILILVLMLHIFIVRDYAQLRIGLAVALIIFSYTYNNKFKYFGYLLGASMHFTGLVLIFLLIYYDFIIKNRTSFLRVVFPLFVIFFVGFFINYLGALDPRIDLYLNWDRDGYGAPVNDFKQPSFIAVLLFIHLYFFRKSLLDVDIFIFCYLAAIVIFVSFSDYSIFSYRLSNVAMSLYPITIAKIFESNRPNLNKVFGICIFIILVSLRDNSFQIINSIQIG